jgi:3-deoxy-manno-octulosonate cytidylyltransferase (CMP-KDO synthetase)
VILNVQGDEPFVPALALQGVLELVSSGRFDLATAAVRAPADALGRPEVVKVVIADNGEALYFSRAPIPFLREPREQLLRDALARQHVGLYGYRREALLEWASLPEHPLERVERLEQLRVLAAGKRIGVYVLDTTFPGGVDTEEDLVRANELWTNLYRGLY